MKCDRCDSEATVHEVMIRNGKRHERHLCESCAKTEGMAGQPHIPITQLLNQFITSQAAAGKGAAASGTGASTVGNGGVCAGCGLSFPAFKQTGLLGCPECYAAFEGQLAPLLQRAHEQGTRHTGRKPARLRGERQDEPPAMETRTPQAPYRPSPVPTTARSVQATGSDPAAAVAAVRRLLAAAVSAEKYEEAAKLRDTLRRLESPGHKAPEERTTMTPPPGRAEEGPV